MATPLATENAIRIAFRRCRAVDFGEVNRICNDRACSLLQLTAFSPSDLLTPQLLTAFATLVVVDT